MTHPQVMFFSTCVFRKLTEINNKTHQKAVLRIYDQVQFIIPSQKGVQSLVVVVGWGPLDQSQSRKVAARHQPVVRANFVTLMSKLKRVKSIFLWLCRLLVVMAGLVQAGTSEPFSVIAVLHVPQEEE